MCTLLVPLAALLLVVPALAPEALAGDKVEKATPHADDVVEKAQERFEKEFEGKDMDKRLRILTWYGMHMHKDVLKDLTKLYLKDKDVEIQAAAARGLGNQLHDPKRAARVLLQGIEKYEEYGSRQDVEGNDEVLNENEATVLVNSLNSYAKLGVKPDKRQWKLLKGLIDHPHDGVCIAMLDFCGATQEYRSLPMILEWFNFYPDGYSWSGGSTKVDTGAAGNKDAKAAKAKWKAKYGKRATKARPKAHEAMKRALKSITGEDFEKPKELKQWMDENDQMLKKHGV